MKMIHWLILVLIPVFLTAGCGRSADVEAEKIALLQIHLDDVEAHKALDVPALMETIGDEFIYVGDGQVSRQSRSEIESFFNGYLNEVQYEKYEDLLVPHAEVSDDGTMGWVISRESVSRTEPDGRGGIRKRSFIYAGIMTYRKVGGNWVKVANVSTFKP